MRMTRFNSPVQGKRMKRYRALLSVTGGDMQVLAIYNIENIDLERIVKKCSCGKVYTEGEFMKLEAPLQGEAILEGAEIALSRNCPCGSTLTVNWLGRILPDTIFCSCPVCNIDVEIAELELWGQCNNGHEILHS